MCEPETSMVRGPGCADVAAPAWLPDCMDEDIPTWAVGAVVPWLWARGQENQGGLW